MSCRHGVLCVDKMGALYEEQESSSRHAFTNGLKSPEFRKINSNNRPSDHTSPGDRPPQAQRTGPISQGPMPTSCAQSPFGIVSIHPLWLSLKGCVLSTQSCLSGHYFYKCKPAHVFCATRVLVPNILPRGGPGSPELLIHLRAMKLLLRQIVLAVVSAGRKQTVCLIQTEL